MADKSNSDPNFTGIWFRWFDRSDPRCPAAGWQINAASRKAAHELVSASRPGRAIEIHSDYEWTTLEAIGRAQGALLAGVRGAVAGIPEKRHPGALKRFCEELRKVIDDLEAELMPEGV